MHKRVDIKSRRDDFTFFVCVREIPAGVRLGFARAQIRSHVKSVIDATYGEGECAAAVRESDAKFWESLENSAEYHRADRERRFGRHADQPRQPIIRHPLLAEHVPWMNENCGARFLGRTPNRLE